MQNEQYIRGVHLKRYTRSRSSAILAIFSITLFSYGIPTDYPRLLYSLGGFTTIFLAFLLKANGNFALRTNKTKLFFLLTPLIAIFLSTILTISTGNFTEATKRYFMLFLFVSSIGWFVLVGRTVAIHFTLKYYVAVSALSTLYGLSMVLLGLTLGKLNIFYPGYGSTSIASVSVAGFTLKQVVAGPYFFGFTPRISGYYGNPNTLGLSCCIALFVLCIYKNFLFQNRLLRKVLFSLLITGALLSFSRTGMVIMLVFLIFNWINTYMKLRTLRIRKQNTIELIKIVVVSGIIGICVLLNIHDVLLWLEEAARLDVGAGDRIMIWKTLLTGLVERPIFGHGLDSAIVYLNENGFDHGAHSLIFGALYEIGLVGLFLLLSICCYGLYHFYQLMRRYSYESAVNLLGYLGIVSILSILTQNIVEYTILSPGVSAWFFWFFLFLSIRYWNTNEFYRTQDNELTAYMSGRDNC